MKRAFLTYFIIFIIILAVLCAVSPQIQEICIFLSYNTLFFIDSTLSFSKAINPLVAWTIVFALLGLIIGLAKSVSVFKLHKKFYLYSFLGIILLLFLINTCSHPLKHNSSREVREEMLWSNLNKQKSYSISTLYINEFPEGKYISEIKLLQESALWDSASVSKSSQVWKLYCDKFKSTARYPQARINYDNILWAELSKLNTAQSYANYLKEFPDGLKSNLAHRKLDKYKVGKTSKTIDPSEGQVQSQDVPDIIKNSSLTNNTDNPVNAENEINLNDSKNNSATIENNDKINLPGGIIYDGPRINNNIPDGYGTEIFPDKSTLKGFYINGKREGEFIYTKNDGSKEKQTFKNGNRVGNSIQSTEVKSPKTSNYIGQKKYGTEIPHGEGKEIFPDGTSLSGNYIDGKRDGEFIFTNKDGTKEKQVFKDGNRIK